MIKKSLFRLASFFLHLISLLPFWLLYVFADILFVILYYLTAYRRKVTQSNLKNAFPEKSESERNLIERKYYRFLADNILESIKMKSMSADDIRKRCKVHNPEEVNKHLDNGKAVLLATGHYANWEWGNLIIALTFPEKLFVIYKPLSNKNFDTFINKMRAKFGAVMVPMRLTLRKIVELKSEKYLFGFASDQTPTRHESQYFTTFLNQPTAVFLGLEKIAKTTNNPVVFTHINRLKRGYYEYTFTTLVEHPKLTAEHEITNLHTQKLEQIIKQKPELWLWSHRRWKFRPEDISK
ncbi:lysophospholipid acyltransferase family protein [Daejeonella oryzae]|uniref:lysophospholipid acyltransferase family protein n=1 Tax=Daejeonella oryzae TaxID=1122943 RepID=UPI000410A9FF|nr:lysophospholipid acyltransferase family protein [Daejeonella oryzae]